MDEPLQLDMSGLCLSDDFPHNIHGNCPGEHLSLGIIRLLVNINLFL